VGKKMADEDFNSGSHSLRTYFTLVRMRTSVAVAIVVFKTPFKKTSAAAATGTSLQKKV